MSAFKLKSRTVLLVVALGSLAVLAGVRTSVFLTAPASCMTTNTCAAAWPNTFFPLVNVLGHHIAGQKSMSKMGTWNHTGYLELIWSWDQVGITGSSVDGCLLLDSDGDGFANAAICAEAENSGASNDPIPVLNMGVSKLYICDNTKTNNCGGATVANPQPASLQIGDVTNLNSAGELTTKTDPWGPGPNCAQFGSAGCGSDYPYDISVRIRILKSELPGKILNVCSYESASYSSSPNDCLAPKDGPTPGFLNIQKNVTPGDGTFSFNVSPVPTGAIGSPCSPSATNCLSYSAATSGGFGGVGVVLYPGSNIVIQEWDASPMFNLTSVSCVLQDGTTATGSIDLANRQITGVTIEPENVTTCTFNNEKQKAHIAVTKNVINNNGGTATAGDFTIKVDSQSANVSPAATTWTQTIDIAEGTYQISELGPTAGYAASYSGDCANQTITVVGGSDYTCTVTNNDIAPSLTLTKAVTPQYGGTASATAFTLTATGITTISGAGGVSSDGTFVAGPYTLSETGPAGYVAAGPWVCTGGSQNGNQITLTIGQSANCKITNTDTPPTLIVVKKVNNDNGGSATAASFSGTVAGDVTGGGPAYTWSGASTTIPLAKAGSFTVTENSFTGYAPTYDGCTGSIGAGETRTCTITNYDQKGTLTIIKHVVTDNGGTATAGQFTMQVTAGHPSQSSFAGSEAGVQVLVDAGSYSVDESSTGPGGYTKTRSAGCTGTMTSGGSATCTITNDDVAPTLVVVKKVINNNGGSATASSFSGTVTGTVTNGGPSYTWSGASTTIALAKAGSFSVSENPFTGYTPSYDGCTDSIAAGETKTCTITNDDQQGTLTIIKHVVNDNGGTAAAGDFTLHVAGGKPSSANVTGSETGVNVSIDGGSFTVTETGGPAGYKASFSGCTGVMTSGGTATCTVTNDDQQPTLLVVKHVINDNGGSKVASNFTMTVTGGSVSPSSFPGSETGTPVHLDAGAYSVSEAAVTGYSGSSSADCTGTIAVGQTKTCTITNDDQQGTLTIIKHVINDNGGTAAAGDFTLHVAAGKPGSNDVTGSETGVNVSIDAGNFTVTETGGPAGYKASFSGCTGVMTSGGTATCTVTNDDQQPTLLVIKHVILDNGGSKVASNFTMSVTGGAVSPSSFPGSETGTAVHLDAGSYSVSEAAVTGYSGSSSADCTGTIAVGQTKTCTITNDDQQGTLTIIKHMVTDNGGTAASGDFTLHVAAGKPSSANVAGSDAGVAVSIDAGNFTVTETGGPAGYKASFSGCTGVMTSGGTATCTVTNDDIPPTLIVVSQVINDNGGTAAPSAFSGTIGGSVGSFTWAGASTTTTFSTVGTYNVTQTVNVAGYTVSYSTDCNGSISIGQTKTCTVTNNDIPPVLSLVKYVDPGTVNDPILPPSAFTLRTSGGPTNFSGAAPVTSGASFKAGTYTLGESGPSGYTAGVWSCTGQGIQSGNQITLGIAQSAACSITNLLNNVPPNVRIDKSVTPRNLDAGGGTVTFTVTVYNLSGSYDPFTIDTLTDTIYGDLTNPNDAKPQLPPTSGTPCTYAKGTVIPGGGSYTCSWSSYFGPLPANQTLVEHDVATVVGHDDDNSGQSSIGTASDDATVTQLAPVMVTNGNCAIDTFSQIFTQDYAYHLTATNNGQFFFNASVGGVPGTTKHVTLQLPWPFVTQGSQPIHVYSSVDLANNCLSYTGEDHQIASYVYLKDYGVSMAPPEPAPYKTGYPPQQPSLRTTRVDLDVLIPDSGFALLRQHIDVGTKGPNYDVDGNGVNDDISYGRDKNDDATDPNTGKILIPEGFSHPFQMWAFKCSAANPPCNTSTAPGNTDLSFTGGTSIKNDNQYQKNVGVGGAVQLNGTPLTGMTVQLSSDSTFIGAAITDANGLYSIPYKQTGNKTPITLTVQIPSAGVTALGGDPNTVTVKGGTVAMNPATGVISATETGTMKNNGTVVVNFTLSSQ